MSKAQRNGLAVAVVGTLVALTASFCLGTLGEPGAVWFWQQWGIDLQPVAKRRASILHDDTPVRMVIQMWAPKEGEDELKLLWTIDKESTLHVCTIMGYTAGGGGKKAVASVQCEPLVDMFDFSRAR